MWYIQHTCVVEYMCLTAFFECDSATTTSSVTVVSYLGAMVLAAYADNEYIAPRTGL